MKGKRGCHHGDTCIWKICAEWIRRVVTPTVVPAAVGLRRASKRPLFPRFEGASTPLQTESLNTGPELALNQPVNFDDAFG